MPLTLKQATAPASEPVTLAEAKLHLRVDFDDDDTLIAAQIASAREVVEAIARRALITQTWDLVLDAFPGVYYIDLPLPPLQSVTSVKYVDEDGNEHTFSSTYYIVDTYREPGRLVLASNASWPSNTLQETAGVRVRFVAGYGDDGDDVPAKFKQAILLLIGHYYEHRESVSDERSLAILPQGVRELLWMDRNYSF